jgi:4-amino-4-deoxy-L-arabinose transferase-like glycosyltransferase
MAGYAGGALLAGFMLSFLPLKIDSRGFHVRRAALGAARVRPDLASSRGQRDGLRIIGVGIALLVWLWNLYQPEAMDVGLIREETDVSPACRHPRRARLAIRRCSCCVACYLVILANLYGFMGGSAGGRRKHPDAAGHRVAVAVARR